MTKRDFNPDQTPGWFWDLIARAAGDHARYAELVKTLSREELRAAYRYFTELSECVTSAQLNEDEALRVAEWTVAQGKSFFFDVYEHVVPLPLEPTNEGGQHFISRIIVEFSDRYHAAITDPE
jgi:hypothetical protein